MIKTKIEKIRNLLTEGKSDGILISSVANIVYLTGYSGFSIEEREAYLVVTKDSQYIITDGRYSETIKKEVKDFSLEIRSSKNSLEDIFKNIVRENQIKSLGVEEDDLRVKEYKALGKVFQKLVGVSINPHRAIKTLEEINFIEEACKLGDKIFSYILKKIKVGMSEKEVAWEMEQFIKSQGATLSFPTIVAFSENSSVPHHQTGNKKLEEKNGQFILLDFGTKINNYCSDMTRTIFWGKPDSKKEKIYKTVKEAQEKAVEYINQQISHSVRNDKDSAQVDIKSNTSEVLLLAREVDKMARDYIVYQGYASIPHSLGHGIGLQVHEHPFLSSKSKETLEEGMVFSIEPGIYIEGFGGVRIEDLYVIEKNGLRQLTKSPKE